MPDFCRMKNFDVPAIFHRKRRKRRKRLVHSWRRSSSEAAEEASDPSAIGRFHHHRRISSHRRRKLQQLRTLSPSIKFRVKKPCAEIRSIRLVVGDGWSKVLGRAGTTTDQPDQGRTRRGWGEKMVGGKDCGRRAEEEEAATAEERGGGLFSTERIFQS